MSSTPRVIAIVSGGMDSVTLAYHLQATGWEPELLSFDYGQRHVKEIECAIECGRSLGVRHDTVDLTSVTAFIANSALTGDVEVPDGHYAEASMRATVVPNRNAMMLSIAVAVAIDRGAQAVATGVHSGDHFVYPDCRPEFIAAANTVALLGTDGFGDNFTGIIAPFMNHDKTYITTLGNELRVPWEQTWSCYKGGESHCGSCGTCYERREAFTIAGVDDPTEYLAAPSYADPR